MFQAALDLGYLAGLKVSTLEVGDVDPFHQPGFPRPTITGQEDGGHLRVSCMGWPAHSGHTGV